MTRLLLVSSENGRAGLTAAMAILRRGGSALDTVETACRVVEDDPGDHSVGYGGMPNVAGEVELDASIMDGRTLAAGAVAAVRGYGNPITLARRVMQETPHVLLVGRGAEQLAAELEISPAEQRTDKALSRWRQRFVDHGLQPEGNDLPLREVARRLTRALHLRDRRQVAAAMPAAQPARGGETGTVNFLALDARGDLASAVSTSGIAWKYPGRVGDSPLIGAGNYCDNRYGAVACTGLGELAIRVSTARSLVLYLKSGMTLREAGEEALRDLALVQVPGGQYMNIVALTPAGEHAGFTTMPGKQYLYMTGEMDEPLLADRIFLSEA